MRLVQISVPDQQQEEIVAVLREKKLGYTIAAGTGEKSEEVIINFLIPADGVEHVLTDLEDVGFDRKRYTVSHDAEFGTFEHVDEVQNRWRDSPTRIAPATLRSKAKDMRENSRSYLWMMMLSAIVATAGLLMDSPAVVVGSMVIAPIVSPVLTASVGAIQSDRAMFVKSIYFQIGGIALAILTATVFSWLIRHLLLVPAPLAIEQVELIAIRLSPSVLALVVGVSAGAAGAYGLATKGNVTIVGVMIAAALIPTAAAAGVGFAWGDWVVGIGATMLLMLSMIGVNTGAIAMLLYLDYRPNDVDERLLSFDNPSQVLVVSVTLLVVIAAVAVTGFAFYQQSSFEESVNQGISDVLAADEYQHIQVVSTSVEYRVPVVSDETTVTVTVARQSDHESPELPDRLAQAISERTEESVVVRVQYVEFDESANTENTQHILPVLHSRELSSGRVASA